MLIAGAQKCGTTSLHHALSLHPEVFMTHPIKEPGYFLPFEVMQRYYSNRGIIFKTKAEYLAQHLLKGYRGETYFGESSTFYTTKQWSTDQLAQQIFDYNPAMKIIYLYRDPIDRIISHYHHELAKNKQLDFSDFLDQPEAFGISCYRLRLLPYRKIFNKNQIHIVPFEALLKNHKAVLKGIFQFLEIDDSFTIKKFPKLNQRKRQSTLEIKALKNQITQHKFYKDLKKNDQLSLYFS